MRNEDVDDFDEVACHAGHLGLQRPHTIGPHGEPPGIAAGDDNCHDHSDHADHQHLDQAEHDHDQHLD